MKKNILYTPDGADGASGGDGNGAAALEDVVVPGAGGGADGGAEAGGDGRAATAAAAKPELTAESLAQAMKAAGVGAPAERAPQQPVKEYSQADFDKAFHVVRPNEDQIKRLLAGGADAVQTITELLHAASKQAVVMSAYQQQEMRDALEAKLSPLSAWKQQQEEQSLRQQFKEENKDLAGFEPVAEEVLKAMQSEKVQFKTVKEAFTALRDRTIKTIKSLPGWEAWKPGDGKQTQNGTKSNMPSLSRGGGSGGAAAGQGAQGKGAAGTSRGQSSVGASVFD